MIVSKVEKFNVAGAETKTYIFNDNEMGDSTTSEVYVFSANDCEITPTGYVDDDAEGVVLKAVDMANLKIADAITAKGVYSIPVDGYTRLVLEIAGNSDIVVKCLK